MRESRGTFHWSLTNLEFLLSDLFAIIISIENWEIQQWQIPQVTCWWKMPLSGIHNVINAWQASSVDCVQSPPSLQKQSGRDFCDFFRGFLLRGGGASVHTLPWRDRRAWKWLNLNFHWDYFYCNQLSCLFSQSLLWKLTTNQEQTLVLTSISIQKRPLVVTVKRKPILHQEVKWNYPQIKFPSHRIDVSAKSQNLIVIQVWNNVICFLVFAHWYILRVGFLRGAFSLEHFFPDRIYRYLWCLPFT